MRIIAGEFGGRRLSAPLGRETRPTSERVREAIFNLITSRWDLAGRRVLDLFAGSGALGLEALSRGAAEAVFVESSRAAARVADANIAHLGLGRERVKLLHTSASQHLRRASGPYDLVFLDPPYRSDLLVVALDDLHRARCLAPGAGLVLESHQLITPADAELTCCEVLTERRYGDTRVMLWEHDPRETP